MANVSQFECADRELSLNILNFSIEPGLTKYKATLAASGDEDIQQALLVSFQPLQMTKFKNGPILNIMKQTKLCAGVLENNILPFLSDFTNGNFACIMFLIEKIGNEVIYKSRDCEVILTEGNEKLCASCDDLFQSLETNLHEETSTELNKTEIEKMDIKMEEEKSSFPKVKAKVQEANEKNLDKGNVQKHKLSRGISCQHFCTLCSKKFRYANALAFHCKKAHKTGYLMKCPFCAENFEISETMQNIYDHINSTHESDSESDKFIKIVEEYTKCRHFCQQCGKTFNTRSNWREHMTVNHTAPESRTFKPCPICGKSIKFAMSSHLKTHVEDVSICPECGVSLKNKTYLTAHMRTHNKIPFRCETCGKEFATRQSLKDHTNTVHLKKKHFECDHCDQSFYSSSKLKMHIRCVHTKEKPFSCEDCDYKSSRSDSMRAHRKCVHSKLL